MTAVGIRQLKDHLSRYLRAVEEGQTVHVTDRGRVIAVLCPPPDVAETPHERLVRLGRVVPAKGVWDEEFFDRHRARGPRAPAGTVERLVDEDRKEHR